MASLKGKAKKFGRMVINILDNGKIICSMEKDCFIILKQKLNHLIYGKKAINGLL